MAELILKGLTKTYNEMKVVNNLNLEIKNGEFLVIVGPSGCGKTTLLRMIAGLEPITDGEIYLDGEKINDVQPKDRNMSMVFQDYALYPHMTVFNNIGFGLKMHRMDKKEIEKRVSEAAELLDITSIMKRKPFQLSGGERQRVALGRAIVRRPKVFLYDEPLSNLDAALRVQMRNELSRLHKELGTTFIYVTHDQVEAMTMASTIAVLNKGILQQTGTPEAIYNYPSNIFVGGFIGSPKMNIIECYFETRDGILYLYIGENELSLPDETAKILLKQKVIGKKVYLGLRPEHIKIVHENNSLLKAAVALSENTGADVYLHLILNGIKKTIISRAPSELKYKDNENIYIDFDWASIKLFDSDGNAIAF